MSDFQAVLFDLDGVLVDAADWHKEAFNHALWAFNYEPLSDEEHERDFNGLSTNRKLEMLAIKKRVLPCDLKKIHKVKQERTISLIKQRCKPVQRIHDVVNIAKSMGLLVGVVTNCSKKTAYMMLEQSGLLDKFDVIITNEDVDGKIKPHPWPYIKAYFELGVNASNVLAIDDTNKGIISAVDARCRTWKLKNFEDLTLSNFCEQLNSYKITI